MNNDIAIRVDGLYKKFCINQRRGMIYGAHDIFHSMMGFPKRRDILRDKEIWALRDISFEVKKGEKLGIVGPNGAGKSTLLRVLSGIYPPDAGMISVRGAIGALIAAGAGFHPDMTGRENIYLNGTIIGLKKREIDQKLEEIVEFAEIGEFIDTPVRFYSSGMYVRLGFSIAAHLNPEILIVDEVLSVGDLNFQKKCHVRLEQLRNSGITILFVTHAVRIAERICDKGIFLDKGRIACLDNMNKVAARYYEEVAFKGAGSEGSKDRKSGHIHVDAGDITIDSIDFFDKDGKKTQTVETGQPLRIEIGYRFMKPIGGLAFHLGFVTPDGLRITVFNSLDQPLPLDSELRGVIVCTIEKVPLMPGAYSLLLNVSTHEMFAIFKSEGLARIIVTDPTFEYTRHNMELVALDVQWGFRQSQ